MESSRLLDELISAGVGNAAGVPCSILASLAMRMEECESFNYVQAPSEGEALAYSCGAWLAGAPAATVLQNSGIGNLLNVWTSLSIPYEIPSLLVCGWRGHPQESDEQHHLPMGRLTPQIFENLGIPTFRPGNDGLDLIRRAAFGFATASETSGILVRRGVLEATKIEQCAPGERPDRRYAIGRSRREHLSPHEVALAIDEAVGERVPLITPTGFFGRLVSQLTPRKSHFYMSGSMGHGGSIALGIARSRGLPVVIVDGDGSLMMRLSTLAFVGSVSPRRFVHILLDNGQHASTGGQATGSEKIDFSSIAEACNYRAISIRSAQHLVEEVSKGLECAAPPTFLHVSMRPYADIPPRIQLLPKQNAIQFRNYLCGLSYATSKRA